MLERNGYPAGVPCWVDTAQPDPEAAVGFYADLFGWEFEDSMPAGAPGRYFIARLRGRDVAAVGSQAQGAPPMPVWNTYVWVDSADDTAAKVTQAGGRILSEPFDVADAGRMAVCSDPAGAVFCVWQAKAHKGAQLVNEPGTWNWSNLNTPDPDGAQAFYGTVFGWEASRPNLGGGDFVMWRRPGYGDFLEAIEPGIRRQASEGVAEGFEDTVAWLITTREQSPDEVPPHWAVTFAVIDVDAVADRTAALGGTVNVPPFDAGPARIAVLSDPQGAVFSVSRYVPGG